MDDVVGINETGLKKYNESLLKYRDEINTILDKYSNIIKKTNNYFNGEAADLYRKKFDEFSSNFIVIKKSFLTYSNDVTTLIDTYIHKDNSFIMMD